MSLEATGDARHPDALDDLLSAFTRAVDVRHMFRQLSAVGTRIVPHDEAVLALQTAADQIDVYATIDPDDQPVRRNRTTDIIEVEPKILDVVPGAERGLQSGISVPLRMNDELLGELALFSRQTGAYSERDLEHVRRLASYLALTISHHRLAAAARDAELERDQSTHIEASMELLRTIADVLDIRTVFPRVSEIVNKMLPHDTMAMVFFDERGTLVMQASSTPDFPDLRSYVATTPLPTHTIVRDLEKERLAVVSGENPTDKLLGAGYRSLLGVLVRARDQLINVGFASKQIGAFTERDVPIARRIADHIALAVSHEQLAEAARQIAEAKARAERLEARVQMLTEELDSTKHARIVGESPAWKAVLKKATQVATTDTTVLLTGESGTGKEVVARFIHRASGRKNGAFIAINCAALPEQLLESELFGYERGAFTSAQQSKPGQIELAAGGVLFLDEVSEMSLAAQAKFLRVLQEREFQRLGGTKILKANIRVIAATNRDLRKAVERGAFREDLFYRLQVFDIHIPPLRERPDDILPLSDAFLKEIGRSFGRPPAGLSKRARAAIVDYSWPGNVRELHNALERAAILCEGGLIDTEHLGLQRTAASTASAKAESTDLDTVERETIARVLRECRWNKSKAAKRLGLTRTKLYIRMKKYGLEEPPIATT
jgi:two-component system NtrC family response regulator